MKLFQIYNLAIKMGIETDFRSKKEIEKMLSRVEKKYQKLSSKEKEEFDKERLTNPFSDTRILYDSKRPIRHILTGIDMEVGEVLLADRLKNIDLIVSHHPAGIAWAGLDDVMKLQADVLALYGVPINIAESLLKTRMEEVSRKCAPFNLYEAIDAAKLLKISFICVHTPADNLVAHFLDQKIKKDKPEYVGDLLDCLKEIPEYKEAIKQGVGPKLFAGYPENRCGKIALTEITGGTSGSPKIYEKMAQAGIGTIVGMHMSEEHKKEAEKACINVVIAGHISSDSLGMNLFLDELEKEGIKITPCSGLIRIKRYAHQKTK